MFVPAKCTHLFQSVDTGLAAHLKGRMRRLFQLWITDEVMAQLGAGTAPDEVREHAEPRTVQDMQAPFGNLLSSIGRGVHGESRW